MADIKKSKKSDAKQIAACKQENFIKKNKFCGVQLLLVKDIKGFNSSDASFYIGASVLKAAIKTGYVVKRKVEGVVEMNYFGNFLQLKLFIHEKFSATIAEEKFEIASTDKIRYAYQKSLCGNFNKGLEPITLDPSKFIKYDSIKNFVSQHDPNAFMDDDDEEEQEQKEFVPNGKQPVASSSSSSNNPNKRKRSRQQQEEEFQGNIETINDDDDDGLDFNVKYTNVISNDEFHKELQKLSISNNASQEDMEEIEYNNTKMLESYMKHKTFIVLRSCPSGLEFTPVEPQETQIIYLEQDKNQETGGKFTVEKIKKLHPKCSVDFSDSFYPLGDIPAFEHQMENNTLIDSCYRLMYVNQKSINDRIAKTHTRQAVSAPHATLTQVTCSNKDCAHKNETFAFSFDSQKKSIENNGTGVEIFCCVNCNKYHCHDCIAKKLKTMLLNCKGDQSKIQWPLECGELTFRLAVCSKKIPEVLLMRILFTEPSIEKHLLAALCATLRKNMAIERHMCDPRVLHVKYNVQDFEIFGFKSFECKRILPRNEQLGEISEYERIDTFGGIIPLSISTRKTELNVDIQTLASRISRLFATNKQGACEILSEFVHYAFLVSYTVFCPLCKTAKKPNQSIHDYTLECNCCGIFWCLNCDYAIGNPNGIHKPTHFHNPSNAGSQGPCNILTSRCYSDLLAVKNDSKNSQEIKHLEDADLLDNYVYFRKFAFIVFCLLVYMNPQNMAMFIGYLEKELNNGNIKDYIVHQFKYTNLLFESKYNAVFSNK